MRDKIEIYANLGKNEQGTNLIIFDENNTSHFCYSWGEWDEIVNIWTRELLEKRDDWELIGTL